MYEEYFGLSGAPFKLNPDPRFFFGSRSHNKAMAYLHYGLKQAEGFIVITGPIGSGKSMLISHLLDQLNRSNVIAAQLLTSNVAPNDLLGHILSAFRIEPEGEGRTGQLEAFEDFLFDQLNRGRRVLLIMDEAQNLSEETLEELRMLSNIDYDGTPLFQVFLIGQPEFRKTFASESMEQLRQRVIASYHLEGLSEEESREYILHRLSVVGWQEDPMITDDAFHAIFSETSGRPRRINTLSNRLMLYCSLEKRHEIDSETVQAVIVELREERLAPSSGAKEILPPPVKIADDEAVNAIEQSADSAAQYKQTSNGDVVVSIERARTKTQTHTSVAGSGKKHAGIKGAAPDEAAQDSSNVSGQPEMLEESDNGKRSASAVVESGAGDSGEEKTMSEQQTEKSTVKPLSVVEPPPVSASVFDRLRTKREGAPEGPPKEATLTDVASAIAAASANGGEVAEDVDAFEAESNDAANSAENAIPIAPLASGGAAEWRKSVVQSINDTRSELKQAHDNVRRMRRSMTDMSKRRDRSRAKIAASLSRAESLLREVRHVWR